MSQTGQWRFFCCAQFLPQGEALISPWRLSLRSCEPQRSHDCSFGNCISFRAARSTLEFLPNENHHLLLLTPFSSRPPLLSPPPPLLSLCLQIWSSPGSSTSTRPSWSRTPAASSRRRRETCSSPKWSPQMLATTPAWWPTPSPRAAFRARPPRWSCAAMVRRTVPLILDLYSGILRKMWEKQLPLWKRRLRGEIEGNWWTEEEEDDDDNDDDDKDEEEIQDT